MPGPLLYKTDASAPARAVMMVADILGVDLDMKEINPIFREQHTPELTKKNPMKTIPFLEEDNFYLADSHAIILYLMDKYGRPEHEHLYPRDKKKRATVNQRLFFDCGVLFPRLRSIMAPTYGGKLKEISQSKITNVVDSYRILELYLSETMYMADEVITIADISIVSTMITLNGLHPIDEKTYPKLKRWYANMSRQDYCKRINEPAGKQHVNDLFMLMQYNKQKSKI